MRALLSSRTGGPETLALSETDPPAAGEGQVVIGVAACGINFPDALIIEDRYQFHPDRPFAPGGEVAGTVLRVGPGVAWPPVGARVMAMCGWGGMAEEVAVPAAACVAMPDTMPFDEGAAFIMTYGTAYHALVQRAAVRPGETMLVLGAAGGVGLATVQLGRALGLTVIAGVSSEDKLQAALAHGAERGFVYPTGAEAADARALSGLMKQHCGPAGVDVVVDPVGGALSEAAVRSLAWNGRFLIVGFPAGIAKLPLNLLLLKGAAAIGVFYGSFTEKEPEANRANTMELVRLYAEGGIRPLVSERFPLAAGAEAIRALAERRAQGKLVVTIGEPA